MAAPEKNQFWKQRSKHGREKIFSSPKILWEACCEYFEATDARKWMRTEFNGKDAVECKIPTETPYTLTGLCLFLDVNTKYFNQFDSKCSEDFSNVLTRVREIIYTQKFEGAAVGAFNANIIARDLGLKEASTMTINKVGKDLADETYE